MTEEINYDVLFDKYLSVCNEVLQANKDSFPYDRIMHQIEFLLKCHTVQVAIYDEDKKHPDVFYDMVLEGQLLTAKAPHGPRAKHPWLLSRQFLEQVAQDPSSYISNPAQLNWKWLTNHAVGQ